MNPFSTIGIFSKREGEAVEATLRTLHQFLTERGVKILASGAPAKILRLTETDEHQIAQQADLAIVVGGDGTLLNAGRLLSIYNLPIVGVNLGRLGFLVDVSPDEMTQQLSEILQGQYHEEQRCLLYAEVYRGQQTLGAGTALNDIVLHSRNEIRMIEFTTCIDDSFVNTQRADGIVVATPTGSTAYSLSSGGPILHPSLEATVLVPICPHTLSNRPLVVNSKSTIEISLCSQRPVDSRVSFDGHNNIELISGDKIIIRAYQEKMHLLHPQNYDYYHILRSKLHWGTQL
ncbi:MAG: NAD kinase (EC [uncultured Thiotrichaceae bacterium]|uniref:NAD kinase n=1 Tax=uncultured Thiotrichaceae bacterium TaxID=298394 RepID=A0A6S6TJF2_9GAMM|nr:MAG: NAD kinase (EC [uncultured Thiotrichaceae bacterium]